MKKLRINFILSIFLFVILCAVTTLPVFADPEELSETSYDNDESFEDPFDDENKADNGKQTFIEISDPIEPFNRAMYHFNDKLYLYVLKPVSKGYGIILPKGIRRCFNNFFSNLSSTIRFGNCILQGKFNSSGIELKRFTINSTIGLLGFFNPAETRYNLEKQDEDFGQTLGVYKIGHGFYFVIPFLGPSSFRDGIGRIGNAYMHPVTYMLGFEEVLELKAAEVVNDVSLDPEKYELFDDAFDPYIAVRDAYAQYRYKKVKE